MTQEIKGQTLRDYGKRKKRYRRIRMTIICILFLAIVVAGLVYWYRLINMTYQNYEVRNTISNTEDITAEYINYAGSVVRYNKDGATAIDRDGDILWNGSYEMMDPIADSSGDYVVVADRGNKSIHIYNRNEEVGNITTLHNIVKVEIANQGVVAALMEDGDTSYIKLFYSDGTEVSSGEDSSVLAEIVKDVKEVGYPMDFTLSEDGKKLIIVFLTVTSGKLMNKIGFYNFGEVGKNSHNFMGGFDYEDIIIPKVSFLNNDVACVFKENGIVLYAMPEKPKLIEEINFEQKIKSVLHNHKYTGVVLEGKDGSKEQILLYDLNGSVVLDQELDFEFNKIFLVGDEIIMQDNLTVLVMKTTGKEKFQYTFSSNVLAFYPINNLNRYFLVNTSEIANIKLLE